jgi:hypothetical protein
MHVLWLSDASSRVEDEKKEQKYSGKIVAEKLEMTRKSTRRRVTLKYHKLLELCSQHYRLT